MAEVRNDFSGPIGDRVPWEEFSKEFLLKIWSGHSLDAIAPWAKIFLAPSSKYLSWRA